MFSEIVTTFKVLARILWIPFFVVSLLIMLSVDILLGITQNYYEFYRIVVPTQRNSIVVSSLSIAPFTSIIDVRTLSSKLRGLDVEIETVTTTLALLGDRVVVVLGVDNLSKQCLYCCYVGKRLAEKLSISKGDLISLSTPFLRSSVVLRVVDIVDDSKHEDMILAPIEIVRLLRAMSYRQASLAIIKCRNASTLEEVLRILGVSTPPTQLIEQAFLALNIVGKRIEVRRFENLEDIYLARIGIPRTVMLILNIALSIVIATGLYFFSSNVQALTHRALEVLTMIGVTKRIITISTIFVAISALIAASTISMTMIKILRFSISIASFSLIIDIDLAMHALITIIMALIVVVGVWRGLRQ